MEKLPVTSYVRLVDIWLIFGQLIPFIEVTTFYFMSKYLRMCNFKKPTIWTYLFIFKVVLATIRELYSENDVINHHGPKVPIKKNGYVGTQNIFEGINLGDIAKALGKYIFSLWIFTIYTSCII